MGNINIVELSHSKKNIVKFLKFAWKIYKGNKYWVPPLLMDKKKLLNTRKNPFFKQGKPELIEPLRFAARIFSQSYLSSPDIGCEQA